MNILVFTDLDGTLLNKDDYSFQDALPAVELLRKHDIPLILVSSKTADELFVVREKLGNVYPFVCENGSLVVVPPQAVSESVPAAENYEMRNGYRYCCRGESRETILKALQQLRPEYDFFGFADMTVKDIAAYTGLDPDAAELANKRAASEPIVWRDTEEKLAEFSKQLSRRHLKIVKGGRFYHVMGGCDKSDAVRLLLGLYQRHYGGEPVYSIALGDSPNDLDMLKSVNVPVVIPQMDGECLQDSALKDAVFAPYPGARGWNDAVNRVMRNFLTIT